MNLPNLDNLSKTGQLKVKPMSQLAYSNLLIPDETRLGDAGKS